MAAQLTTRDRCDRCGAQAYTVWWHPIIKGLLLWCAHHTHEHEAALESQDWELTIDERHLLAKPVREPEPA